METRKSVVNRVCLVEFVTKTVRSLKKSKITFKSILSSFLYNSTKKISDNDAISEF